MTCTKIENGFICSSIDTTVRLRTDTGRYIYMEWHHYFGPFFFHDKQCSREFESWWEYEDICASYEWWMHRGYKG